MGPESRLAAPACLDSKARRISGPGSAPHGGAFEGSELRPTPLFLPLLQPEARPTCTAEAFPLSLARRQPQVSRDPTLRLSRERHSAPIGCEG